MSKTQFWKEWKDVTRLVKSAQIAFGTEIRQWDSLTEDEKKVTIIQTLSHNNKKYNLSVQDHIASLSNERLLSAMILQFSCGAIEEHGRLITNELLNSGKLQLYQLKVKSFRRLPLPIADHIAAFIQDNAIENWGQEILSARGLSWNRIMGGQEGITEVMAVRNAIAHGVNRVNKEMIDRFTRYGGKPPWKIGYPLTLDFSILQEYRARLKSFARIIND